MSYGKSINALEEWLIAVYNPHWSDYGSEGVAPTGTGSRFRVACLGADSDTIIDQSHAVLARRAAAAGESAAFESQQRDAVLKAARS